MPLLIGGATTSAKHTAVKIAPVREAPVVHVVDASRAVGVVEQFINPEHRSDYETKNCELQQQLRESYQRRSSATFVPYDEARKQRFTCDWQSIDIPRPTFTGTRLVSTVGWDNRSAVPAAEPDVEEITLANLRDWIDWSPFFLAWEMKGKYPKILKDPKLGEQAQKLFDDAQQLLDRIVDEQLLTARGVYGFWPAASTGEDIAVYVDSSRTKELYRLHCLRQQWQRKGQETFYSLADFIAPADSGREDHVGAFAVTTGQGCDELAAQFEAEHDDYNAIMVKALADRLAEAFAEQMHARVRREWQYGQQENLSPEELIAEKYRGIRPAPGYPAQPDHSEKRTLWQLLDAEAAAGITLTETCAMHPAASVCGLYFAHPQARYFAVDRITREQVEDYAHRKGMTVEEVERWLASNLAG